MMVRSGNVLLRCLLVFGLISVEIYGRHLRGSHSAVEKEPNREVSLRSNEDSKSAEEIRETEPELTWRGCCERQKRIVVAGFDMSGRQIELDLGHCRKTCNSHSQLHHLQKQLPANLNITKAILQSARRSESSCPRHSICEPARFKCERVNLVGDPAEFDVITECRCQPKPEACERRSRHVLIFPDSPYQTDVDVGMCGGRCQQGTKCVEVIEQCGCRSECYRVSRHEVYYELVHDRRLNRTEEKIKDIDIGRCVGTCSSGNHLRCVMRSRANPDVCLMSLVKKNVACSPKTYTTHQFVSRGGAVKTVLAVNDCSCK
ncbi:uncharacterized protein [Ptychodera flava]|uniref:uncharacterized protein isoform X2 n=1 Tax=Ptychodera flava TaxID=63121 RepID=UPI00396A68AA